MGTLLVGLCQLPMQVTSDQGDLTAGIIDAAIVDVNTLSDVEISDTDVTTTAAASPVEESGTYGYTNLGIATAEGNLNVRQAPDTSSAIVGKMPEHAGCEVLEVAGDWIKISSGNVTGYVLGSYLLTGEEAKALADQVAREMATVNTTTLNVRTQPNTQCSILAQMGQGEELEVLEKLDGWVKVAVDTDEGYVSTDYVTVAVVLPKAHTLSELQYGGGVSETRVNLVNYALQFVGNPYVWGGTSLTKGADCSGFTLSVYKHFGVSLPHSSKAQANYGKRVKASEAKPGDLFFYGSGKSINHVAIYIGNGKIVHASNKKTGIKVSNAYYKKPICVVRLID